MKLDPKEKPFECKVCGYKFGYLQSHYGEQCVAEQLRQAQAELAKLRLAVLSWREAWYQQREIIGWLAWSMPTLLPDSSSLFFQCQWNKFLDAVKQYSHRLPLDDKPREVTVRTYVDPFDNIEE